MFSVRGLSEDSDPSRTNLLIEFDHRGRESQDQRHPCEPPSFLWLRQRPACGASRLYFLPGSLARPRPKNARREHRVLPQFPPFIPDEDQAALCWRGDRTLLTFDYDFLDPQKLPTSRNPGVIILDRDRRNAAGVAAAVFAFSEFERFVGAITRGTRVVIRGDGHVSVWTSANPRRPPNFRYLLRADSPRMIWQN